MDWRFSLFLLALFGLLIGFSWGTSEGGLCSAPYITKMLAEPSKDGALNCFEFWFNRYQTLVAAALAFLTAVVAVRPALAQIKEMRKQTDQNTVATMRARHTEILRSREYFFQATAKVETANICADALINPHPSWGLSLDRIEAFRNAEDALSSSMATLERSVEPIWTDANSLTIRTDLINSFYQFGTTAGEIRSRLDSVKFASPSGNAFRQAVENSRADINKLNRDRNNIFDFGQSYFDALNYEERRITRLITEVQPRAFS